MTANRDWYTYAMAFIFVALLGFLVVAINLLVADYQFSRAIQTITGIVEPKENAQDA